MHGVTSNVGRRNLYSFFLKSDTRDHTSTRITCRNVVRLQYNTITLIEIPPSNAKNQRFVKKIFFFYDMYDFIFIIIRLQIFLEGSPG